MDLLVPVSAGGLDVEGRSWTVTHAGSELYIKCLDAHSLYLMQASTWTDAAGTFISSPSSKSCVIIQPLFHEFFIAAAFSPKCKMELRLPALRALLSVLFLLRLKSSRIICGYYCFLRGEDACQESIARGGRKEGAQMCRGMTEEEEWERIKCVKEDDERETASDEEEDTTGMCTGEGRGGGGGAPSRGTCRTQFKKCDGTPVSTA